MTYQSTVAALVGASTKDAIVDKVVSTVGSLITSQGPEATLEAHRFMLYYTGTMEVRIAGMMKHLEGRAPKREESTVPALKDTGLMAGWRSVDNSSEQINHLLIGLPFLYAILITTHTNKVTGAKSIHSTVGTFVKMDYQAMGTNPEAKTETVSSYKEVSRLLGYLSKLTAEEPIIPLEPLPKEKTMSYAQEQYVARWINSNGSLPHKSTIKTPTTP